MKTEEKQIGKRVQGHKEQSQPQVEKTYLTEQEAKDFQTIQQQQQNFQQQLLTIGDIEVNITALKKKVEKLKLEAAEQSKDLELNQTKVIGGLGSKYGKFSLGENFEVIKAE